MHTEENLMKRYIKAIVGVKEASRLAAKERLDSLAKPPGSLGDLEALAERVVGITENIWKKLDKKCILIFCADNGVVAEGVASAPQSVTYHQTINFTKGLTGVAVLAKTYGVDLKVVDVGVNYHFHQPNIINRKIRMGTANLAKEPAMTRQEVIQAIGTGIEMVEQAKVEGYKVIGVGEMGIGNTTTSSAVLSVLLDMPVETTTGKGGGLGEAAYQHKIKVIKDAIKRHEPDAQDPIDVLAKVGGLDLAAMVGAYIGAAYYRIPVVIDGLISITAAVAAVKLAPAVVDFLFASHLSYEQGYGHALGALGLKAPLRLQMRLGEGSGCPMLMMLLDGAMAILQEMATFAEAEIVDDYVEQIRDAACYAVARTPEEKGNESCEY